MHLTEWGREKMETLSHSAQDYLEAILVLTLERGQARVKEVAELLGVKKPSVVAAVKGLMKKGLVKHEHYGCLELTPEGMAVAKEIYHRHQTLFRFLHRILGVKAQVAEKDACQMEHYISPQTLDRLVKFVEFVESFPNKNQDPRWLSYFKRYAEKGEPPPCAQEGNILGGKKVKKLSELKVGEKAIVKAVRGDAAFKKRVLAMGVVPGTELVVEKVAPLGDPVDFKLRGFHLSLRKEEAKSIEVEVL